MSKVPTDVKGLDDMLGGGLPRGRCILVCGGPGAGKTILGIQFLYNGAIKHNETGLYLSLSDSPVLLKEDMRSLGMNLEKLEKDGKLAILDASPVPAVELALGSVEVVNYRVGSQAFRMPSLMKIVKKHAEEIGAKRIVIDSLSSLILQYSDDSKRRNAILDLFQEITGLGTTTLVTTELRATTLERELQPEEFLSQGVIVLGTLREGGEFIRTVQIEKMRGVAHDQQIRPYRISGQGIVVYSKERLLTAPIELSGTFT